MKWNAAIDVRSTLWNAPKVTAEVRSALQETAEFLKGELEKRTPVRTGRMRSSWLVNAGDRTVTIQNFASNRGTFYAGFVDTGTRRMKPRHITRDSLQVAVDYFKSNLTQKLEDKWGGRRTPSTREIATAIARLKAPIGTTQKLPKPKE